MRTILQTLMRLPMLGYRTYRWRAWSWLRHSKMWERMSWQRRVPSDRAIDVMVMIVDHFEPVRLKSSGLDAEKPGAGVAQWCERFQDNVGSYRDSDGRPPQYSWFFAADFPDFASLQTLSDYAFRGMGEVEFHLHHGFDTHGSFSAKLHDGLDWFNRAGAMMTSEDRPQQRFAYVAGDWSLDNGCRDDSKSGCNTELIALRDAGCYADFTFPALGSVAQPKKTNAIYYATDCPAPKSYDAGTDVAVGHPASGDLMMFQGPLVIDWRRGRFDDGSLENSTPPAAHRLANWLNAHVHIAGRPEWVFIKLFTHGIQNHEVMLGPSLRAAVEGMVGQWTRPPFRLHFVTAREAYNIVKAAEAGRQGNPNDYRDYAIPRPANRQIRCSSAWRLRSFAKDRIAMEILEPGQVDIEFAEPFPVASLRGEFRNVEITIPDINSKPAQVRCDGPFEMEYRESGDQRSRYTAGPSAGSDRVEKHLVKAAL
jgi:hypothetical protein